MIAIKARRTHATATVLGPEGEPVEVILDLPEGLEWIETVHDGGCGVGLVTRTPREAVPLEEPSATRATLWLVADDAVPEGDGRRATRADVPMRMDLPATHPLHGKRVFRQVPAGCPDLTLDATGRVVPVDLETGEPIVAEGTMEREVPR